MGIEPMDPDTRRAFEDIVRQANAPVVAELTRLRQVLLEGDDELEIPSLVKQQRRLERRVRRLEMGGAVALVIFATLLVVTIDPGIVESLAKLLGLVGFI